MSAIFKEVRASSSFKTYQKILQTAQGSIELDALRSEALGLHTSRTSRQLYGAKQYSGRSVMEALLKDLSFRARLVEIRVKVSISISNLEEAIKAMRRYVSTEYADDLREFSTSDQRKSFVDRILKSGLEYLGEGQTLIDMLDMLIKDIDQASFQLRNAVEILKLLSDAKGGRVV